MVIISKKNILGVMLSIVMLSAFPANAKKSKRFFVQLNAGYAKAFSSTATSTINSKETIVGSVGNSALLGVETGIKINRYFGVGVSLDYIPKFSNKSATAYINGAQTGTVTLQDKSYAAMLNLYLSSGNPVGIVPYIVAGVGKARNTAKTSGSKNSISYTSVNDTITSTAYRIGGGMKYFFNSAVNMDIRAQYMDLGKYQTGAYSATVGSVSIAGGSYKGSLKTAELMVGLGYNF